MPCPRDNHRYRGLLLDFGGVLTTSLLDAIRRFAKSCGFAENALLDLFRGDPNGRRLLIDVERGAITQIQFETGLGELLGVDPHGLVPRILGGVEADQAILTASEKARAAGVRTGVLSNSWGLRPFDPYADWQLEERFDAVVISERTGTRKPDPAIYLLAAERLGVPPERCVFVDDLPHNLEPARELGMAAVLKTGSEETVDELERLLDMPLR